MSDKLPIGTPTTYNILPNSTINRMIGTHSSDFIDVINDPKKLLNISKTYLLEEEVQGKNIENMVGSIEIPLGLAGPIKIKEFGEFTIPLATTEGALVASTNRGLKAMRMSKHLLVNINYSGMTRGPVFEAKDLKHAVSSASIIKHEYFDKLSSIATSSSSHLTLKKIQTQVLGKYVFVRFRYDTSDAMGMNMVTYATEEISKYLCNKLDLVSSALSANFCIDKKVAYSNWFFGRGYQAWVETIIDKNTLKDVLKTDANKLMRIYNHKIIYGSWLTGATSFNAQFANIIAAFFAATGQDLGHVGESSQGILVLEKQNEDIYATIWMPNLNIGSIGGGTRLPSQKEAINLILKGKDKNVKNNFAIASCLATAVLAAELSLLSALSTNDLAKAHKTHTGKK